MAIISSLVLAADMATRHRDAAAALLKKAQQAHAFALEQLAQLEGYAADTDARWMASAQTLATPELMRHHYQFMERLGQAVSLQQQALEKARQHAEAMQKSLLQAEFRLFSLGQALKLKQLAQARVVARREQKQSDEFAALQYSRSVREQHHEEHL